MPIVPRRERVVVVADLGPTRRRLLHSLRDQGVDVFTHVDASDLLDFAAWAEPALVILGMADPAANLAALRALRALPALGHCAIAYMGPAQGDSSARPAAATSLDQPIGTEPTAAQLERLVAHHARRYAARTRGIE